MSNPVTNPGSVMVEQVLNEPTPSVVPGTTAAPPTATKTPGATPPGTPQVATPDDKASSKLNMLIRREKMAIERERTAKTIEAQLQAKQDALAAREAKIAEFENLKQTNPRKALELLGLSYADLTNVELNDGELTPELKIQKLEERVKKSEEQREAERKAHEAGQKELQARQEQQATEDFRREIGSFLKENGKSYELTNFEGQEGLVYDVINTHYERTIDPETGVGKIMSIKEAADRVEKFLKGKYEKAVSLDSVKSLLAPKAPAKPQMPEPTRHKPPTLTNNMSAAPSKPRTSPITDDERIQKAIAYAKGLRA